MVVWRQRKAVAEAMGKPVPERPLEVVQRLPRGRAKCGWCMSGHHAACLVNIVVDGEGNRAGCACECP
ncbi:MAG: hypothetical protein GXX79_18765 [Actinomycetales bacterium]|nr:hypothetical protein [Actinomycetales bacterium]